MNIKRMSLRFNLDSESDRIAWEYLESVGESKNKAIIEIIKRAAENDRPITEIIRETITDCLAGAVVTQSTQNEPKKDIDEDESLILEAMDSFLG